MSAPEDDQTRLAPPAGPSKPSSDSTRKGSAPAQSSSTGTGWLSSSGGIDHGRFPPGTLLGGRYRIVGRLGKGGMGEVFRADDLKLGQPVALKFLPPDVDRDPARLTQLHTEVRMARQVSHPNVCRVYDIDEVEGHTFLSMEYVDGEDLSSLLRRVGRFNEGRGLELARHLCAGLAAAHERGVVHRDLKPANVMIDGDGKVRITDFGLAGIAGEALRAGTPAYMAPEQIAGGEVTARSDIYALGLVLYEIFTGERALDGKNLADLIRRREQGEIVRPSALVRELSPEIDRAIMRCLDPEPAARPASALAVAAALPGGDPLAAALAAGEMPSPEMVAAAGEAGALSRRVGVSLLVFVLLGLIGSAIMSDRTLLVARVSFHKSADVLEDRAREILALAGYTDAPADAARGVAFNTEQRAYMSRGDRGAAVEKLDLPVLRFWYRVSSRALVPTSPSWTPLVNDPPLDVSGMATVILDERARLQQFVAVPPQLDKSAAAGDRTVDWKAIFDAAGLSLAHFTPAEPQWTPRIYADKRLAWDGPHYSGAERIRVEAAEYRGRPVSFQMVGPWTSPARMVQPAASLRTRVLAAGGTLLALGLLAGAVALVRHNLKSGHADRQGALRVAVVLMTVWGMSWALGARHSLSLDAETGRFFTFIAFAVLNTAMTWALYLALEPFVRRYCPDILISWTRLVSGQFRDARVGRDVLIGVTVGVFLSVARLGLTILPALSGEYVPPRVTSVQFFLGSRYIVSGALRVLPNALQSAMIGTFAFVLLRAFVRRSSVAIGITVALLAAVIISEGGDGPIGLTLVYVAIIVGPMMFIFLRFGLLSAATALVVNQVLASIPLTADLLRPYGAVSTWTIVCLAALAGYAFHVSRAGRGLFRGIL